MDVHQLYSMWHSAMKQLARIQPEMPVPSGNPNVIHCICHVYTMYIPCIYYVYTMYIPRDCVFILLCIYLGY